MSLPSTATIVDPLAATIVAYANKTKSGSAVSYDADSVSGNADLTGQPTLRFDGNVTKNGIVQDLLQVKIPVWDSSAGEYDGYRQLNISFKRQSNHAVADGADIIYGIAKFLVDTSDVRDALAGNKYS